MAVSEPLDWRDAFVAFGALAGEPREAIAAALGDETQAVEEALRSSSREVRARAVARVAALVMAELDAAGLR